MAFGPNVEESKDARNNAAPAQNNNAGGNGNGAVERLRTALENGGHIAATNKIGVSSGVTGLGGRELTAREAQWGQQRAESTAAYNARKAAREERRALNSGNPRRAAQASGLAGLYAARGAEASREAERIGNLRAKSALDSLARGRDVFGFTGSGGTGRIAFADLGALGRQDAVDALNGGGPKGNSLRGAGGQNDPNALLAQLDESLSGDKPVLPPGPLSDQAREIMSSVRSALAQAKAGGAGSPSGQSGDLFSQFMDALSPKPTQPVVQPAAVTPDAPDELPSLRMVALSGGGGQIPAYDYNGMTVFLGDDIDTNDATAVRGRIDETNDLIDMMNEAYA